MQRGVNTNIRKKNSSKRIIIDYKNNPNLEKILSNLEKYFIGMNKAEITKVALAELFHKKYDENEIHLLTDNEEESLDKAMKNKSGSVTLPKDTKLSEFVKKF